MGGCTLSAIRATRDEALEEVKAKVIEAVSNGLCPDTELVVLQNEAKRAELYRVDLVYGELGDEESVYDWRLERVEKGVAWHIVVAARFERAMKPGEWLATIHVHT